MENQPQKTSNQAAWVILAAVIVLLAAGAYYFLTQEDENTNNSNAVVVTNTAGNENVNVNEVANTNTVLNTNTTSNTNEVANTDTDIDISEWLTYENEEYGYSFQYPPNLKVEDYSQYNSNIFGLNQLDDKTVPLEGGAIPISVKVFENTAQEVKNAAEDKNGVMNTWNEINIGDKKGEYSIADQGGTVDVNVYVIPLSSVTVLIKTTNPDLIIPTFIFANE